MTPSDFRRSLKEARYQAAQLAAILGIAADTLPTGTPILSRSLTQAEKAHRRLGDLLATLTPETDADDTPGG